MFRIKYLIYSIALAGLLGVTSCSDFLEVGPTSELPGATAVTNVSEAESALNGVYTGLASQNYYGTDMISYGEVRGTDMGTTVNGDRTQSMYQFGHTIALNSTSGGYFWQMAYSRLSRVNNLITKIEAGSIAINTPAEQTVLDDIYGQALSLRALMHFDLVRIYGEPYLKNNAAYGAIIADRVITKDDKLQRSTVAQTYDFIVNDLRTALGLDGGTVYLKKTMGDYRRGVFSYYASEALLAKVYLYMGRWSDAYTAATDVIANGPYSLISNAEYVNSWSNEFTSESIFEVHSSITNNADRESIGSLMAPGSGVYGAISATPEFIALMLEDPNDVRLQLMQPNKQNQQYAYVAKYPGRDGNIYVNNTRVLRLSDIYLIAAEAGLYTGAADASRYLNDIRKRANPAVADVTATIELVMTERRKELVGEGHRYFDIIRNLGTQTVTRAGTQGLPIIASHAVPQLSWNNNHTYLLILPIPQTEINSNPNIYQNAGYPTSN